MKKNYFLALICLIISNLQASDSKDIANLKSHISKKILRAFTNIEENPNEIKSFESNAFETPLGMAIDDADVDSVRALIKLGANANLKVKGFSYIFRVVQMSNRLGSEDKYVEMAKILSEAGAYINEQHTTSPYAVTQPIPIMIAAERHNPNLVKYLIANGADILRTNTKGKDSLDYAEAALKYFEENVNKGDLKKQQEVVDILRNEKKRLEDEQRLVSEKVYESGFLPKVVANLVGKYS